MMEATGATSKITLTIKKCDKIISSKNSNFNLLMKSEFCGKILNESAKIQCSEEAVACDYGVTLSVTINEISTANELSNNPLIIYAYEILPKEKKQKEEKMNLLGYFVVDLLPIIQNTHVENSAYLVPNDLVYSEELLKTATNSIFYYEMNCAEKLFTDQLLQSWSRFTFVVGSLYGLPDVINVAGNTFIASLLLPLEEGGKEEIGIFFDGQIRQNNEKNISTKRYPKLSTLSKRLYYREKFDENNLNSSIAEMKDLPREKQSIQRENSRVEWNMEINFYLDHEGTAQIKRTITQNRFIPLEICAISPQQTAKNKKTDDESQIVFHAVSYINFWPLLYPGEKNFGGCFLVKPFEEIELLSKGGRRRILTEEFVNVSYNAYMAPGQSKSRREDKKEAKKNLGKSLMSPCEKAETTWDEGRSFVSVECLIDKPMVIKRTKEDLADSVYKYIVNKRPKKSRETLAEIAVNDFRKVIAEVSDSILAEVADMTKGEEKDAKVMLNSSDIYYEIKEKLKFSIINIVREKYLKKSKINDENELNNFLSDLYVFLMDQIHVALNQKMASVNVVPDPKPNLSIEQLEFFSQEAISINRLELGLEYLRQIVAREPNSAKHWLSLGIVSLKKEDFESSLYFAEECLSRDETNYDGQIFSAVLNALLHDFKRSEEILQYNVELYPENKNSLIILGLVYEQMGNDLKAEMAFRYAVNLNTKEKLTQEKKVSTDNSSAVFENLKSEEKSLTDEAFLSAAQYLFSLNLILFCEKSLTKIFGTKSNDHNILLCRISLARKDHQQFEKLVTNFLVDLIEEPEIWALMGHSYYERENREDALNAYNRYTDMLGEKNDNHAVLLRLGEIYFAENKFSEAKYNYKMATQKNPTHLTWLGLGTSCYRLGELEEAELALSEANCLNSLDYEAWSYLCLICLRMGRKLEAEQTFKYSIRLGLSDHCSLYEEVTETQETVGFGNPQFNF